MATDAISIQKIYDRLTITPEQLKDFCIRWQIAELAVFGSILRDDFCDRGDDVSDIDLLYSLNQSSSHSLFDIMQMREELEKLCHRRIDLISKQGIKNSRNWLRRQEILNSEMILYAQK
ncbi:nucleotidyltransferase domain-containing protein [Limnothrix sp. FACHB-708]|uniref:nucleotidyltransferase family protein n=1 Tax=unclassified Limnothrix TaxID=2632864 RepID=UPI00168077FB|nr:MULTISPECIES: nucleotidyltransferase domain-containing protein [unclassified Limnothrix]MBD2161883.1 nucleotidyltransferase domain-containing protein [Limnothrix sp. FACHB-1083]MBD2192777.1 nucleotidyltransferase domain-containing protein [Limnothrix sp. FACHB-1088]MBD2553729.1 nucleotidyltransferase domain-containing protein [Limnothrix sp. FACHB-708]MBD2591200.1 nucleotidyltransferase domain-containing protein [Limnothrix sp. FACHB-406]